MEYIVTGNEMKLLDDTTSQVFLVPSVVLMEQASAGVVRELVACFDKSKEFAVITAEITSAKEPSMARLSPVPNSASIITSLLHTHSISETTLKPYLAYIFFCSSKSSLPAFCNTHPVHLA